MRRPAFVPKRGDVIHIDWTQGAAGREMKFNHFGIVLSDEKFNQTGLCYVVPITHNCDWPFAVRMENGMEGCAVPSHLRCIDFVERGATRRENSVSEEFVQYLMDQVLEIMEPH